MSTAELVGDGDRIARRRLALRAALRSGDLLAAARASSRLRPAGIVLAADELAAARAARVALGRSLREARWRRERGPRAASALPAAVVRERSRAGAVAYLLSRIALAGIGLWLLWPQLAETGDGSPAPPPPPEQAARPTPIPVSLILSGRGRIIGALPSLVAEVSPEPTVEPTAAPTETPATPPPATGAPGGQPGGVSGGTPGGVVGGVPGGTGSGGSGGGGAATATPSPTPNVLPSVPPSLDPNYDRITFRIVDSRTLQPLAGVCVVIGTDSCGPSDPHTNVNGLWWLDLPRGQAARFWDFRFFLTGYATQRIQITYTAGQSRTYQVRLVRR